MDDTSSSARPWATNARSGGFVVEGAELEPVGVEARKQNIYFLRVSQDGRSMAFVMGDYDVRPLEVWVMENFLQ